MKYFLKIILSFQFCFGTILLADEHFDRETSYLKINDDLLVHYGVYSPKTTSHQADIFYFHGFGDSFENHEDLFSMLASEGFRVISFDFPDHGRTLNNFSQSLHFKKLDDVANIGANVYKTVLKKYETANVPLYLSGWSTGGLISTRIAQDKNIASFSTKIEGLILYAPGLNVKLCVGEKLCEITNETLTKKKSLHERVIEPRYPAKFLLFASSMLYHGHQAQKDKMPNIPTLVFHSSLDDQYVNTAKNIKYFKTQSAKYVTNIHCPHSFHELDNETVASGSFEVKQNSLYFLNDLLTNTLSTFELAACSKI